MLVLIRPEQIVLEEGDEAVVEAVEYYGHDVRYSLLLDDGQTIAARCSAESIHPRGTRVALRYGGTNAVAWPTTTRGNADR